jgi:Transposase IS116/IS110/IS902 family
MVPPGVGKLTAMTLVAEIGDIARFPTAAKLWAWAGPTPRWATLTARSATATSPTRDRPGCGGSCRRPPRRPSATHVRQRRRRAGPPPGKNIATVAIARRLLARSVPILSQLEEASAPEKARTGRARVSACAGNTAVDLTEQPGSGLTVMRTHPRGPKGCMPANSEILSGPSHCYDPATTTQ